MNRMLETAWTPYIPPLGMFGKLRRLNARAFARYPMEIRAERPIVSVTFDDFPQSAATTGYDMLERFGWRGTFYASAGLVGQTTHLGRMFEQSDIERLMKGGHEIGCHTYSHRDTAAMVADQVADDVARNEHALAAVGLTQPLATFAFPYGEASPGAKSVLIERFGVLRSVRPGINRNKADRALLRAVALDGGMLGIDRAISFVDEVARHPGWLILYGHDVRDEPSRWGCTPDEFHRVLAAIAASGAEVLPMREALGRLHA